MTTLSGSKIAFLATSGVEQVELTQPWEAVQQAGGQPVLVSPQDGSIQAFEGDVDPKDTFEVDASVDAADPDDYAAVVLPGGTTNPDALRIDDGAMDFLRAFVDAGKPVAAICHGPWSLVEIEAVKSRTLTSWPSLRTDITNAGGIWVDEQVHVDEGRYLLITSRNPGDLDAFCEAIVENFGTSSDAGKRS